MIVVLCDNRDKLIITKTHYRDNQNRENSIIVIMINSGQILL